MQRHVPLIIAILVGIGLGMGVFTFGYAKGSSYLTNDPAACANCHVMQEQYQGWMKGSHRKAAVCNDCHAPAGFFGKYTTKAINGYFHSFAFTTGRFPDLIQITKRNHDITNGTCMKCHEDITSQIHHANSSGAQSAAATESLNCVRCHRNVGHQ
jgi:cytochrome c nitrite reductase small subunit